MDVFNYLGDKTFVINGVTTKDHNFYPNVISD